LNKVAHYLQEHLIGEVFTGPDVRRYFSTDASIFQQVPAVVVYPRNENDVRKAARFTWQLAERGRLIPITARGMGTDFGGAGIILVFPAHMHKILELDPKTGTVAVQPGTNFGKLQQTLHTHGRFLPPYPASLEYSTVGGAAANNTSGEKSTKYGSMRNFVRGLRVVLTNGELIETGRLSKRELNRKMGLASFEGEIYRALDTLIEENNELIKSYKKDHLKVNNAGYPLWEVKRKDGSFDLTPLIVGSQGTLGIITEIVLDTEGYNPEVSMLMASFDDRVSAMRAAADLKKLGDKPSVIDFVDRRLLEHVQRLNPNQLKEVGPQLPAVVLFVEFDNESTRLQKRMAKKARRILEKYAGAVTASTDEQSIDRMRGLRDSVATALLQPESTGRAIPVIEDAVVPIENIDQLLTAIDELTERLALKSFALWGHLGEGNVKVMPFMDIAQVGDRQKLFRLQEEYYTIVTQLGGTISGEHNDGRLRGALLDHMYSPDLLELMRRTKNIFDPQGILAPDVKVQASINAARGIMRQEFSQSQYVEHMPRV
jgi:FAD/FMN-containing dehydrogenase